MFDSRHAKEQLRTLLYRTPACSAHAGDKIFGMRLTIRRADMGARGKGFSCNTTSQSSWKPS
jgi:hypothetical protein